MIAALLPVLFAVGGPPQVSLQPTVAVLRQPAAITVTGVQARTLEARLVGATTTLGRPLGWTPLRPTVGGWHGVLPAPELRGVYAVELRAGTRMLRSPTWRLRVFALGTLARPSFTTAEAVARWWVRTLPGHPTFVALKHWPRPAFDRRDRRLHRLLVVAYSPPGRPAVRDRLGMFVTAVRDGLRGRWRLLEATAQP